MIREKEGVNAKWNRVWINLSIIHSPPSLVCACYAGWSCPGNILYMFTTRRYTGRARRDEWTTEEFLLQLVGMSLSLELSR